MTRRSRALRLYLYSVLHSKEYADTTRAKILDLIITAPGLSTAALAGRAGVSLASGSEHATILREAGLITSYRDGRRVFCHCIFLPGIGKRKSQTPTG